MDSKDHPNDYRHFVGCFEQLLSWKIGVYQMHESFRIFQQFEVILNGVHEKFVDVNIYHFDDSQCLEGSVEDCVDEDEQFSSDEDSYFFGSVFLKQTAKQVEKIQLATNLTLGSFTRSISFNFTARLIVFSSGVVRPIVLLRIGRILPLC